MQSERDGPDGVVGERGLGEVLQVAVVVFWVACHEFGAEFLVEFFVALEHMHIRVWINMRDTFVLE